MAWSHIGKERGAVAESASDVKTGRRQILFSRSPMKGDSCHTADTTGMKEF